MRYDDASPEAGQGPWCFLEPRPYPLSGQRGEAVYAVAVEQWLQRDLIPESDELWRAVRDMIADSCNDATGLVVDLLTGTTSGPALHGERWELGTQQRRLINGWLQSLAWPELEAVNCCQKTWGDGPYGRENVLWGRQRQPQWLVHGCDSPDAGGCNDRCCGVTTGLSSAGVCCVARLIKSSVALILKTRWMGFSVRAYLMMRSSGARPAG